VRAYVGAAEVLGTLVVASVPADAAPVAATLHLRAPVVAAGAATYVVRGFSPKTLLGGGTLRPVASAASGEAESILAVLRDAGLGGATVSAVAGAANLRAEVAGGMLADLAGAGRVLALRRPAGYVDAALADGAVANVTARLVQSEAEMPWLAGMTGLALARATGLPEPALTRVLFAAAASGRLAHRGGYFTTEGFTPRLSDEQRAFFEQSFGSAGTGGPLPLDLLRGRIGGAKIRGLAQAFDTLLETGSLVKVGDAVYRGERIAAIRAQLESALRRDRQITPAGFRDLIGTSRKFAVPLLEWFDAHGVTLRSGDVRVLRS
jgi:selenocysteine-specific elongation factor